MNFAIQTSPVFYWGKQFSNQFDLSSFKNILDIGCRQGYLSAYLAKQYPKQKFVAIDNVSGEIEQACSYHLPNLIFETQDLLRFDHDDHYDAVVSFSCLHWIKDKYLALQNIYRALKPLGKAYLQFFALHGRPKNDRFLYQTANQPQWKHYFGNFTPDYQEVTLGEFCVLLQKVGFIVHQLEFKKYETNYSHAEELQLWWKSWASHQNRVPKRKKDRYLQEAISGYLAYHKQTPEDPFPYYEYILEVICEKPSYRTDELTLRSRINLSPREMFVLKHYLQGKTAKEIASLTFVTSKAVEFHLANIKMKLNCYRRSEIYQVAIKEGLFELLTRT